MIKSCQSCKYGRKEIRKRYKNIDIHSDFCIMPKSKNKMWHWEIERKYGLERHEVFGAYNRWKSIEDGLVIFLRKDEHTQGKYAIHNNKEFREYVQWVAMNRWCEYYHKTTEDFRKRYGFCAIETKEREYV